MVNFNAHPLVVIPAHQHGYLDHFLRVLKDKVNVVTSKVLLWNGIINTLI